MNNLNLNIIKHGYHYGVADASNHIIIEPRYDSIQLSFLSYDYIIVRDYLKVGLYDSKGDEIVPCIYENIKFLSEHYFSVRKNENGLFALFGNGREITDFKYTSISSERGFFIVKESNHYGVLNSRGEVILECVYDSISYGNYSEFYFPHFHVIKEGTNLYFDLQFHTISILQWDDAPFGYQQDIVKDVNGKYGAYLDVEEGYIEILPPIYSNLDYFGNIGRDEGESSLFITGNENDGFRLIRTDGSFLFNNSYEGLEYYSSSRTIGFKKNGLWGAYDLNLSMIFPPKYAVIKSICDNLVIASYDGQKYGIDTFDGSTIIPHVYSRDQIYRRSSAIYDRDKCTISKQRFEVNGKYGTIDSHGNIIVPFFFDRLDDYTEPVVIVSINNRYGIYRYNVGLITQCIYDSIIAADNNLFIVCCDEKKGLMCSDGTLIVPVEFDNVRSIFSQDKSAFVVEQFGKKCIYTVNSGLTYSGGYDDIMPTSYRDIFIATTNGYKVIIDSKGHPIVDWQFSNVNVYGIGIITSEINGFRFYHVIDDGIVKQFPFAYKNGRIYRTNRYNVLESFFYRLMVGYDSSNLPEYFIVADSDGKVGYLDHDFSFVVDGSKPQVRPLVNRYPRYSTYVIHYVDWNGLLKTFSTTAESEREAEEDFWDSGVSWQVFITSIEKV